MKTINERRNFFKKAALSVIGSGALSVIPFNLFQRKKDNAKTPEQKIPITIDPMAVKREKRK